MHCTRFVRDVTGVTDKRTCGLALVDDVCPLPPGEHMTLLEIETLKALRQAQYASRIARERYGNDNPLVNMFSSALKALTAADTVAYARRVKGE